MIGGDRSIERHRACAWKKGVSKERKVDEEVINQGWVPHTSLAGQ